MMKIRHQNFIKVLSLKTAKMLFGQVQ
jgi:hypothetical protein